MTTAGSIVATPPVDDTPLNGTTTSLAQCECGKWYIFVAFADNSILYSTVVYDTKMDAALYMADCVIELDLEIAPARPLS